MNEPLPVAGLTVVLVDCTVRLPEIVPVSYARTSLGWKIRGVEFGVADCRLFDVMYLTSSVLLSEPVAGITALTVALIPSVL